MERIAFIKTGWAVDYRGEEVVGRHQHINRYAEAHERFNFLQAPDGRYYAYVHPIGAHFSTPRPLESRGWTLIFVAARDGDGPITVVGYYENATFERQFTDRPEYGTVPFPLDADGARFSYVVSADKATLIPLEDRQIEISGDHMKRTPVVYVRGNRDEQNQPWREELASLAERIVGSQPDRAKERAPFLKFPDAEHRKRVELAAMQHAYTMYDSQYDIGDVSSLKLGFDLLFSDRVTGEQLHVEVKGTSMDTPHFFLTRNEYNYHENPRWRLFVVTGALDNPVGHLLDYDEVYETFDLTPFAYEGVAKQGL
ncbi:DUF3883 domain-containing protein [Pseudomonas taiwanensis]|uniref:DUF3883 domain-containing protein n=1 Tax=Pseudomonas taiwanensis TaxID=470150 RepID=UPI0028DFA02D|nr:DUF3883 domain-containing protein [Pseudomonas taiwanensis]MDT8925126.1 DUF3883 domain-containing protein [Pseudomonas taiwanensis]